MDVSLTTFPSCSRRRTIQVIKSTKLQASDRREDAAEATQLLIQKVIRVTQLLVHRLKG